MEPITKTHSQSHADADARGGDRAPELAALIERMAERRCSLRQIVEAAKAFARGETPAAFGKATRPACAHDHGGADFKSFWRAFPDRGADNPQGQALAEWDRAVASCVHPAQITAAARAYAAAVSGRERRFICSAARWLSEGRWRDGAAVSGPPKGDAALDAPPGAWIAADSPEGRAWAAHWRATKGKSPPLDSRGGWRFPSRWPPSVHAAEKETP